MTMMSEMMMLTEKIMNMEDFVHLQFKLNCFGNVE